MPPKKPAATKPAAKGTAASSKGAVKAPAKGATAGAAKGTATSKAGATGGKTEATKEAKAEAKPVKKVLVPEDIGLKQIAGVMGYAGDVGVKLKESNRWLYIIDRNGNVGTFIKYRDVNYIVASLAVDFQCEPMRKALMGSLRFGKPLVVDISDTDQAGMMGLIKERFDEIYAGLYDEIMDRSIMEEDKCTKLYRAATDSEDYKNRFDYRTSDFQFIILTNLDPATTAMEDFFPLIVN